MFIYGQRREPIIKGIITRQINDHEDHSIYYIDSNFIRFKANVVEAIRKIVFIVSYSIQEEILWLVLPLLILDSYQQIGMKNQISRLERLIKHEVKIIKRESGYNTNVRSIQKKQYEYFRYLVRWKGFPDVWNQFKLTRIFKITKNSNEEEKNVIQAITTISKNCINPLFRYFHTENILIKREDNKIIKLSGVKTIEIRDLEIKDGSINFPHYKRILEQIDVLSEIKNSHFEDIEELKEKLLFKDKSEEKNIVIDELSKMKDAAVTIIEEYKSKIITYVVSIVILIVQ
jgi:hypothetical protein